MSSSTSTSLSSRPPSRYIAGLLSASSARTRERELLHHRAQLREREAEEAEFGARERFVTPAYRERLQEHSSREEEERQREAAERKKAGHVEADSAQLRHLTGAAQLIGALRSAPTEDAAAAAALRGPAGLRGGRAVERKRPRSPEPPPQAERVEGAIDTGERHRSAREEEEEEEEAPHSPEAAKGAPAPPIPPSSAAAAPSPSAVPSAARATDARTDTGSDSKRADARARFLQRQTTERGEGKS